MVVLQQFAILFVLGSLGIVLSLITAIPLAQQQLATLPTDVAASLPPLWVILLQQGLMNAVLLAGAVLIGIVCTPAVELRSHLLDNWVLHKPQSPPFLTELQWSLGLGTAVTGILFVGNRLLDPWLPEALQLAHQPQPNWLNTLTAIVYGGVTEELLLRWGFMSLLVWFAWKFLKQGVALPSHSIYWGVIVIAAIVFGVLHLPATAALAPITGWVVVRAIVLNGIAGIAYGWLFWQYSLEAAMIAHASFHGWAFILNLLNRN